MVTTLTIDGMHAVHAVRAIHTALSGVEGIAAVDVRLGLVTVEHDGRATVAVLRRAIAAAGFVVRDATEAPRRLPIAAPRLPD